MKELEISKGYKCKVDDDWYEMLKYVKWNARITSANQNLIYARSWVGQYLGGGKYKNKEEAMHNIICDHHPSNRLVVDHINRDTLDNRRSNLRIATKGENSVNSKRLSRKYKGVFKRDKRYMARLTHKKIDYFGGRYKDEKDAAIAYNMMVLKFYGYGFLLNDVGFDYSVFTPVVFYKRPIPYTGHLRH